MRGTGTLPISFHMFDDVPLKASTNPPEDIFSGVEPMETLAPVASPPPEMKAPVPPLARPMLEMAEGKPLPAGLDPTEKVSAIPRPMLSSLETDSPNATHGMVRRWLVIVVVVLFVVVVALALARLLLQSRRPLEVTPPAEETPSLTTPIEDLLPQAPPSSTDISAEPPATFSGADVLTGDGVDASSDFSEPIEPVALDTDRDGLTDDEEAVLGTSPRSADTDNDGLSDRDEIKVWATNPLNPDTDGDSFLDGQEVNNGFNPKGPGRAFEVPKL